MEEEVVSQEDKPGSHLSAREMVSAVGIRTSDFSVKQIVRKD